MKIINKKALLYYDNRALFFLLFHTYIWIKKKEKNDENKHDIFPE